MNRFLALHRRLVTIGPHGSALWLLFGLLATAGWFYGLIVRLRRRLYRIGLFAIYRAPVPVISVGNLAAGGTGKTPMVDHLVGLLSASGRRVAVVSRGYGGRGIGGAGVVCAGKGPLLAPEVCGDEPYLLARRNPGTLVFVARRRADGVRMAVERFGAEVIVLDDGFQHLAVARDLDIVLLDARLPFGNGQMLPAGILREPPAALKEAGLVVLTRSDGSENPDLSMAAPLIRCRHRLADEAASLDGEKIPLERLAHGHCVAFAGIADPQAFFSELAVKGVKPVRTLAFADHAAYGPEMLGVLADAVLAGDFLVTTEKDGVKLASAQLPVPCYQIPMTLEFFHEGSLLLERALDAVIEQEKS